MVTHFPGRQKDFPGNIQLWELQTNGNRSQGPVEKDGQTATNYLQANNESNCQCTRKFEIFHLKSRSEIVEVTILTIPVFPTF